MVKEAALEMFVGGLVLDPSTQAPIVVLKDESGQVALPIWIGIAEATSIASVIKQLPMTRPLTHDLMYGMLQELGVSVQRVVITELRDSTYYSELVLSQGDKIFIQDSRPSDAIALALRASAPIYVAEKVLEQAKVAMEESGGNIIPGTGPTTASSESSPESEETDALPEGNMENPLSDPEETADFKNIDKGKWEEILNQLDPDDFKYKV